MSLAGAAATINCLGSLLLGAQAWPDLGNILLFIAAGALPFPAAALTAGLSTLTEIALFPERTDMLRVLFLVSGAALLLKVFPRLPLFGAVGVLWLTTLAPTLFGLHTRSSMDLAWSNESLILMGLWDLLLASCAGTLLLNPVLWGVVNGKPRHLPLGIVLTHTISSAALFPLIGAVLILGLDSIMRSPSEARNVVGLVACSLVLATWLASRIALLFGPNASPLLQSSTGAGRRFRTLSRLAAEGWEAGPSLWDRNASRSVSNHTITKSRAILASSRGRHLGVCAVTRNGTVAFMNDRFKELAQITNPEPEGRLIEALSMHSRLGGELRKIIERSFSSGQAAHAEIRLNELSDDLAFLQVTTEFAAPHSSHEPESLIVSLEDITSRRTLNYEVILAQRRASLQTLVSGMGHALNNALTSIGGSASTALRSDDPFKLDQSLKAIVQSTREAAVLIRQLLEFSDARSCSPKEELLDRLLRRHAQVLSALGGEASLVQCSIGDERLPVSVDAGLMLLAISNLVVNARESYHGKPGPISIALGKEVLSEDAPKILPGSRAGIFARIQVSDSGEGMAPAVLRRTLDPEQCQDASAPGPGLALATAYAIVRAHDGFLTAESHPEHGTTISLYLPLLESHASKDGGALRTEDSESDATTPTRVVSEMAESTLGELSPPADERCSKGKILVIEDDDSIREVVLSMLSTLGYSVQSCSDGREALTRCEQTKFDLVLVDLVMPKVYGLEVIAELRRAFPDLPTLLMTGSGHLVNAEASKIRLLSKPFDIEKLEQVVQESLAAAKDEPALRKDLPTNALYSTIVH
jgi:signal transduction histidine kinase/CheY-like chemotaxis protein